MIEMAFRGLAEKTEGIFANLKSRGLIKSIRRTEGGFGFEVKLSLFRIQIIARDKGLIPKDAESP